METKPVLAVRGEAVLEVPPEIARIEVSVAARDSDRTKTLQLLAERTSAVEKILDSFPDAIEHRETSGMRINPQLGGQARQDRESGYLGAVHHAVIVTGFDRLGELMAALAEQELAEVGGPWWELRPGSPVHRDARIAAARDAVRRARDYAGALGSELAGLVELADARLAEVRGQAEPGSGFAARLPQRSPAGHSQRTPAGEPQRVLADQTRRTPAGSPRLFGFELAPAMQTVRATVEARFTISKPDLAAVDAG
jgi:uncharacterized protein